jgi:hypothetical protein
MAEYMSSPLLIHEGDGHTFVYGDISTWVDDEATRYLEDPNAVQDKVCRLRQ